MQIKTVILTAAAVAALTSGLAAPALATVSTLSNPQVAHHLNWQQQSAGHTAWLHASALRHDDDNADDDSDD